MPGLLLSSSAPCGSRAGRAEVSCRPVGQRLNTLTSGACERRQSPRTFSNCGPLWTLPPAHGRHNRGAAPGRRKSRLRRCTGAARAPGYMLGRKYLQVTHMRCGGMALRSCRLRISLISVFSRVVCSASLSSTIAAAVCIGTVALAFGNASCAALTMSRGHPPDQPAGEQNPFAPKRQASPLRSAA
jgi:hypothetical protein